MQTRNATEADLAAIDNLIALDQTGATVNTTTSARFAEHLRAGSYRPNWIWVAATGGEILGAAIFWGPPSNDAPMSLDALLSDPSIEEPTSMWTSLLHSATVINPKVDYHIFLPGSWHNDESIAVALEPRLAAATAAGLTEHLERYRYEWTNAMPVPARSKRLSFRAEPDDAAWLDMFARVADGSLDAATRDEVRELGTVGYAEADLSLYKGMPAPREWWKIARNETDDVVGFGIPSANQGGPVVGFLGVLPEHRGQGYVDDILAEITADLAGFGAQRIVADTDSTNTPMAAAFDRAGYQCFGIRLVASHAA